MYESHYRQILQSLCAESFADFIRYVDPEYQFNWHHIRLINALQDLADRKIKRLVVMMPPRHGKSRLVSQLFPSWLLGRNPNEQVIAASYSAGLASFMNRECQRIITGDAYKRIFPNTRLNEGGKEIGAVRNNDRFDVIGAKGHYVSAGVGGGITGVGCTLGIIDDPVKNSEEADSPTYRNKAWEWYTTTFKTRFEKGAVEVVCQTRWHEDDLTGRILENTKNDAGTVVLSLPALAEQPEPERGIGEPLWAGKYSRPAMLKIQSEIGSRAWNALYQQRPSPDEGSVLKKAWFAEYDPKAMNFAADRVNFYFDTAYTDKEKNDPTAGIAYVKRGADFYVLDCRAEWLDFTAQARFVQEFCQSNGYTSKSLVRIEPKATGKSLVQVMKAQTRMNILEANAPKESKQARVNSVAAIIEAGRVHLPKGMAWTDDFKTECATFPNAAHDDRVDCLTGMILSEQPRKVFRRDVRAF